MDLDKFLFECVKEKHNSSLNPYSKAFVNYKYVRSDLWTPYS